KKIMRSLEKLNPEEDIDMRWDIIEKCIREAANSSLPKKKKAPEIVQLEETDLELRKLKKAIKDINKSFQKLKKKKKCIETKDKEDLKVLKEIFETDLNIQLGDFNEDTNEKDLAR
ncbi:10128_t:CDS:1, partial [Gigaspora rosea]